MLPESKPLQAHSEALVSNAQQRFVRDLPWRLGDAFAQLDPGLAAALLDGRQEDDLPLDEHALGELRAFAEGARGFDDVQPLLWRLLCRELGRELSRGGDVLDSAERRLLVFRVLQHASPQTTAARSGIGAGKPQLQVLREAVKKLLS